MEFHVLGGQTLFAFGKKEEAEPEIIVEKVSDMQDRYNTMSSTSPGMIMLGTSAATIVPKELTLKIDEELSRQLTLGGKIKPVLIQKWLASTFFETKANNPFSLMHAIKTENYSVPLQYICKPYVFQVEKYFILHVNVYSLSMNATPYPVSILRMFETMEDIPTVIEVMLEEMHMRMSEANRGANKKRIVIDSFSLDFLKLVALESGEFEFINAPFIDQYGVSLRDGDDFFSLMLGYILSTTQLYEVMRPADFSDFAISSAYDISMIDYFIEGSVQLSAELSVLYVIVRDARNNSAAAIIQYPLHDCSLKNIWNAYREISVQIIASIEDESNYGIVPPLKAEERGMFINNMFAGWDDMHHLILPKGMHEIQTGSYTREGSSLTGIEHPNIDDPVLQIENTEEENEQAAPLQKDFGVETFYVLLDTMDRIFTDREGEYVWNFLNKK
jgi:hypothetical protein